jgi:hypothetical protein
VVTTVSFVSSHRMAEHRLTRSSDVCTEAVYVAFCSMQQSGVWLGFSWWAAGPWWGYVELSPRCDCVS